MGFSDVLDQALDLLRHRGRVTYCALKREFHLDDDFIEDLKEEIIHGQPLAVDKGSRVLWDKSQVFFPSISAIKARMARPSPRRSVPSPLQQPGGRCARGIGEPLSWLCPLGAG
jgi:hypothetical protein